MFDYAQLVQDVLDGNESALKAYGVLKQTENLIKDCLDQVKDLALEEAAKHPEKTFKDHDFIFERRNGAARYSFTHIAEWKQAKEDLKAIETKAKQAYSAYKNGLNTVTDDGELQELPKVTYSTDSLIVKG